MTKSENSPVQTPPGTNVSTNGSVSFFRSIGGKFAVWCFVLTGLAVTVTGTGTYLAARQSLQLEKLNHLTSVRESKLRQVQRFLENEKTNVRVRAGDTETINAMRALATAFAASGATTARSGYLGNATQRDAGDGSAYTRAHARYHLMFRRMQREFNVYEIGLIDAQSGNIVYTSKKEDDFGTSLTNGPYSRGILAVAYNQAKLAENRDAVFLTDFDAFEPSGGIPAAFLTAPIYDEDTLIGVLATQLSINRLNEIMQDPVGLGETGEVYLVGPNRLMRSDSRFETQSTILHREVNTEGVARALTGETSTAIIEDYRGIKVLSAFGPMEAEGVDWVVVAEMDESEALAHSRRLMWVILCIGGFLLPLLTAMGVLAGRRLSKAVNSLVSAAAKVAKGELDVTVASPTGDEIGELADSFNAMTQSLRDSQDRDDREQWLKTGQAELLERMRGDRDIRTLSRNLISYLTKYIGGNVGVVFTADSSQTLRLAGSYAHAKRKKMIKTVRPGEGLAGQAILERQTVVIRDIPDDYVRIQSALGETVPKNLVICPLIVNDTVKGCIEIGSLTPITDLQLELLDTVSENMAIAIRTAHDRKRLNDLLEESQHQTKELQSQREELKASNEELEEQTTVLKASEETLTLQSEELKAANEELEEKTDSLQRQKADLERQRTELERSQRDLEDRTKDLQLANKYKSEFLSNMSHEIRSPLNSMLILSQALAENKDGNLSDSQVESATVVHSSGQELLQLINEILDLSKVEAGKMELAIENVLIEDIVTNLSKQFAPVADQKGLDFATLIGDSVPETLATDAQRVQQILKNLLSNAFKFTKEGSVTLKIDWPNNDVRMRQITSAHAEILALSVTDTGVGIAEDKCRGIFVAFQQGDGSTSRLYGGTGLGLTISRELTTLLGGELHLDSSSSAGSTFTLYLPLDSSSVSQPQQFEAPTDDEVQFPRVELSLVPHEKTLFMKDDRDRLTREDRSLLIVDDDIRFVRVVRDLAGEHGYKYLATDLGREALALTAQYAPSAIVLDLGLPDIDGRAVLETLKRDPNTRHIPVHIVTCRDQDTTLQLNGALGFLTKTGNSRDLDGVFSAFDHVLCDRSRRVLVVEDDAGSQTAIRNLIDRQGLELTMVETGKDALDQLASTKFDCIILDLSVPDISGFELVERIPTVVPGEAPPIIVYSGHDLTKEECALLERHTSDIVLKGAASSQRLVDDLSLFLHSVEGSLPPHQQEILTELNDPAKALEGRTVLIVDDDMRNIFALSRGLSDVGLRIESADNGQLALDKLDADPDIDVVLLDLMMPVMDGIETTRRIRASDQYADVPIIVVSAKAMPEDRDKALDAGANDYVTKPVDMSQLTTLLRIWVQKQAA